MNLKNLLLSKILTIQIQQVRILDLQPKNRQTKISNADDPPEPTSFEFNQTISRRKKRVNFEPSHVRPVPADRTISIRLGPLGAFFRPAFSLIASRRKVRLQGVSRACIPAMPRPRRESGHAGWKELANSARLLAATGSTERNRTFRSSSFFHRGGIKKWAALWM